MNDEKNPAECDSGIVNFLVSDFFGDLYIFSLLGGTVFYRFGECLRGRGMDLRDRSYDLYDMFFTGNAGISQKFYRESACQTKDVRHSVIYLVFRKQWKVFCK